MIERPRCPMSHTHGFMELRTGKRGDFYGCVCYPECAAIIDPETGEVKLPARAQIPGVDRDQGRANRAALLARLDPHQSAVAAWSPDEGHLRVDSSAGSGKTTTVTALVASLLERRVVPAGRLIITAFTRAAADELYLRLARLLPKPLLDSMWLNTFHALALTFLRGSKDGWRWDSAKNLDSSTNTLHRGGPLTSGLLWWHVLSYGGIPGLPEKQRGLNLPLESLGFSPSDYAAEAGRLAAHGLFPTARGFRGGKLPQFAKAWTLFERAKRGLHAWDFSDALSAWQRALRVSQEGPTRPERIAPGEDVELAPWNPGGSRIVIVDEAQDNNRVQLDIAKRLVGRTGRVVLVGDAQQSIYAFSGAYPKLFREADTRWGAVLKALPTNYRSRAEIVELGNKIRKKAGDALEAVAHREAGAKITACERGMDPEEEAERLAEEIKKRIEAGESPSRFCVLVRTNSRAAIVEAALLNAGLHVVTTSKKSALTNDAARDFAAYLLLADATDPPSPALMVKALDRVYKKPKRFISRKNLGKVQDALLAGATLKAALDAGERGERTGRGAKRMAEDKSKGIKGLRADLANLSRTPWAKRCRAVADLLAPPAPSGTGKKAQSVDSADRRDQFFALADIAVRFADAKEFARFLKGNEKNVARAATNTSNPAAVDALLRGEEPPDTDTDAVTVATAHSAKGLEWPVVYLSAGRTAFPHSRGQTGPGGPAEELRLFYVACTRAREELHISWSRFTLGAMTAQGRPPMGGPGRFVNEIVLPFIEERWGIPASAATTGDATT